jgi:hypothetical protein
MTRVGDPWGLTRNRSGDPQVKAYNHEYGQRNAERLLARNRAEDPAKKRARWRVKEALRQGLIVRGECEAADCDRTDTHAHHDDYSRPLEVRWLCPHHHALLHRRGG